jgi:hypothetical protein
MKMKEKNKKVMLLILVFVLIILIVALGIFFTSKNYQNQQTNKFVEEKVKNNLKSYQIVVNKTEFNRSLNILKKLNETTEDISELKKLMEEPIETKYKAFLFKLYVNYYGIEDRLLTNQTIYCKDLMLNAINLNYKIYSVYGEIDSDKFIQFKGNWTELLFDLRKKINNLSDNYLVVKALKTCKI